MFALPYSVPSSRPHARLAFVPFCASLVTFFIGLMFVVMPARAQDDIRKNLMAAMPNFPNIVKIQPSPIPGLFELSLANNEVVYTDAQGKYLLQGELLDVAARVNLTQARVDELTAVAFKDLPIKDAFTVVRGNGQRKMAVFTDPNCGFCKRLEAELQKIDNVTIYQFLFPILGPDSITKAKNAWCAPKRSEAWLDWMLRGAALPTAPANCNTSAIDRNLAFGHSKAIRGTPAVFFMSGKRVPGAMQAGEIEKQLLVK